MPLSGDDYAIERVQRFPEPAFGRMVKALVRGVAVDWDAIGGVGERTRTRARRGAFRPGYTLRIAAFAGDTLVGWSVGWQDGGDRFYMALSAVAPAHRRRGLYTRIVEAVITATRGDGFAEIQSRHRPDNHAVLLAKLGLGFVVTGYETSATFGDMVRLTLPLTPARRRVLVRRFSAGGAVGTVRRR